MSLASGTALAVLQFLGVSYWPMVLAAAWLAAIAVGSTPWAAVLLALAVLAEVLTGYVILRLSWRLPLKLRGLGRTLPAALVALAVPVIGATLMASVGAPSHFWEHWRLLWATDAAGLLVAAPLWTRFPREASHNQPVVQTAAEGLANLHFALKSFETSPRVVVKHTDPASVQQHL